MYDKYRYDNLCMIEGWFFRGAYEGYLCNIMLSILRSKWNIYFILY